AHTRWTRGCGRHGLDRSRYICCVDGANWANRPFMQPLVESLMGRRIAVTETRYEAPPFSLPRLDGFKRRANSRYIRSQGLFCENVLVGRHGSLDMQRAETRWSREENDVYAAVDHLLIGVQPYELIVRLHHYFRCKFGLSHEVLETIVDGGS